MAFFSPPPAPRAPARASREELTQVVREETEALLRAMGFAADVLCRDRRGDDSPHVWIEILSKESRLLIGERGSTLAALEHVLRRVLRARIGDQVRIIADVNSYRLRRIDLLRRLARDALSKVRQTGRAVVLEPMRPADRRIVHVTLGEEEGVTTESAGEEPRRRVIVRPRDSLA